MNCRIDAEPLGGYGADRGGDSSSGEDGRHFGVTLKVDGRRKYQCGLIKVSGVDLATIGPANRENLVLTSTLLNSTFYDTLAHRLITQVLHPAAGS